VAGGFVLKYAGSGHFGYVFSVLQLGRKPGGGVPVDLCVDFRDRNQLG
jgi:hypothetical protein